MSEFQNSLTKKSELENSLTTETGMIAAYDENKIIVVSELGSLDLFERAHKHNVQVPKEMLDFIKVMVRSAESGKYPANNWMGKDGIGSGVAHMHDSMFHHLSDSRTGIRQDHDSGFDPLLHLACRALMLYYRYQKGLEG